MRKKYNPIEVKEYIIELRYKYYNYNRVIQCHSEENMHNVFLELSKLFNDKAVAALDKNLTKNLPWNEVIDMNAIASISYYTRTTTKYEEE